MDISKFGPPEIRGGDIDFDIYFTLTQSEAASIGTPATQALVTAAFTAYGGPYGAVAASLINGYFNQIAEKRGPNGCSVKMTIRNSVQLSEFIAEPI